MIPLFLLDISLLVTSNIHKGPHIFVGTALVPDSQPPLVYLSHFTIATSNYLHFISLFPQYLDSHPLDIYSFRRFIHNLHTKELGNHRHSRLSNLPPIPPR